MAKMPTRATTVHNAFMVLCFINILILIILIYEYPNSDICGFE